MRIESEILQNTLSKPDLHTRWANVYYSGRNNIFYEIAFDYIKKILGSGVGETILDAGCGNGAHSVRLAQRGFKVTAVDFSDEALKLCNENLKIHNLDSKVKVRKASLLELDFKDDSFDNVLCWGVLMHIPEIKVALNELCRVIKPGGNLILCEVSKNALETTSGRFIKLILNKQGKELQTDAGIECWTETSSGNFLVRKMDFKWLKSYLKSKKFQVIKHFPGQFTELYTRVFPIFLKNIVLAFNEIWFKYIKLTSPSLTQIIIFRKNVN
jgi:ubiquinone/menaquinone biosynthesis C-methylase UbiE